MRKQTSAIERLRALPPLFRGADLTTRFQWDSKTASQYLYLWKKRNLIEGLGGHSDVFANVLTHVNPNWEKALLLAMPSAVIIGIEILRRAGWTTQIPARPCVAVNPKHPVFNTTLFEVQARPLTWFATVAPGLVREASLPVLAPAWALADMLHYEGWGKCGLWPDDLDFEVSAQDQANWQAACLAFGLPQTQLANQMVASR